MPKVSVVIVSWNTRHVLDEALASLYSIEHGVEIEVIVVDNGSMDGSVEMVRERWPEVIVAALPENVGFGAANNVGLKHASGDYVLLLNSDTKCLWTTIRGLVAELQADPTVGCVGARHINRDGSLQRSTNAFPTLLNDTLELSGLTRFPLFQSALRPRFPWWSDHTTRMNTGWVNGACMMLRRSAIDVTGGFDEAFFLYVEEVDLCYRIRQAGWRVIFTPTAEVVHLEGRSLDSDPALRLRLRFWGHTHFYRKHYSKARHFLFCALVSVIAAGRLVALLTLAGLNWLGYTSPQSAWEFIVLDRTRAPYASYVRAWVDIMRHRSVDTSKLRTQMKE